ncbi:hypothetical protein CVT26_008794 [Gymnopilus dilepis]|uniref:JmjC domain-containing protein n=1 Tax=Gymnopilus dilepis TaxID=231916 RepID=A0A409WUL0_9AGAR|nr:hypothetical protein CVT26_008794 [Gymnopilus dilepis]
MEFEDLGTPVDCFQGKVRKAMLCPVDRDIVVISSHSRHDGMLRLWSISSNKSLYNAPLNCRVLDLNWNVSSGMTASLIVLTERGELIVYKYRSRRLIKQTQNSNVVHPPHGTAHAFGFISSHADVVVTTVGDKLMSRKWTQDSPMTFHSITLSGRINGLQLLDTRRVLVSSSEERKILEYDLSTSSSIRIVALTFNPVLFMYCASRNEVVLLDRRRTLHFLDTITMICSLDRSVVLSDEPSDLPVYASYAPDGMLFAIATGGAYSIECASSPLMEDLKELVKIYSQANNFQLEAQIDVVCSRPYAIVVSSNDLIHVYMPEDEKRHGRSHHTWSVRTWCIKSRAEPAPPSPGGAGQMADDADADFDDQVQNGLCFEQSGIRQCKTCYEYKAAGSKSPIGPEECRFNGFRLLITSDRRTRKAETFCSQISESMLALKFNYHDWYPRRTPQHLAMVKNISRNYLLPLLQAELLHVQKPNYHRRSFNTTAFAAFSSESGFSILSVAQEVRANQSLSPPLNPAHGAIERLPVQSLSDERFEELWARGVPFLVSGLCQSQTPEQAMELDHASTHPCAIQQSSESDPTPVVINSTLEEYFRSWHEDRNCPRQVRDYPPAGSLQNVHPEVAKKFHTLLEKIAPSFLCLRGPMNLASYWPKQSNAPDMGPKIYIAESDIKSQGTTHLHMDHSAAVNIMLHTSTRPGTLGEGGARWEIWPPSSTAALSKHISPSSTAEECEIGMPILCEKHYVPAKSSPNLAEEPWSFVQHPGDAVFIPPGCPHQVTNLGHSVKIASDFICPFDISNLRLLEEKFRAINLHHGMLVYDNLVNLDMTLWFAWRSLAG